MREIIRHIYEYLHSGQSGQYGQAGFTTIDDNYRDNIIPKKYAAVDSFLAGAVVNSILPPTVFAELQRYLPKVVEAIVAWFRQFLGENTLALLPLINIVFVTTIFFTIEIIARCCINGIKKQDALIHTLLPGIKPISRVEALTICCLAFTLETWHGYQQDRHDDSALAQKLHALFLNELFTSFVLFNGGRLVVKAVPPVARCVTTGSNCLFAGESHPIRVFDVAAAAEDGYRATDNNSDTQSLRSLQ